MTTAAESLCEKVLMIECGVGLASTRLLLLRALLHGVVEPVLGVQHDGSPLDKYLTLYDAVGRVLADLEEQVTAIESLRGSLKGVDP